MRHSDEFIQKRWDYIISKVDKYFHEPIVNSDDKHTIREFIISSKKSWAFDMISNLIFNYDIKDGLHVEDYQLSFSRGSRLTGVCHLGNREYRVHTQSYLNGNTRVVISFISR